MTTRSWSKAGAGAAALLLVLGAAACGDDDDEGTVTTDPPAGDEVAAYCEPFFEFQDALFETPEEADEAAPYIEETLVPLMDRMEEGASDDARDSIEALTGRIRHATTPEGYDEVNAEFEEGGEAIVRFGEVQTAASTECGYERIEVDLVDFDFEGVPASLSPGRYAFVVENATQSGELHEMGMLKRLDASLTLDEALALDEDELFGGDTAEFVGFAFAPPGGTGVLFADLEPGTYYYACFIPVGSGSEEEPSEDSVPHHEAGMKGELTVE